METFVYYMAVLLLVAVDNIIMEAEECKNDDSAGMEPERRVSLAPTGMRCVRTSIYTR